LTRWKKDAKEFTVKLTNDYAGSIICRVPKPILEMLGKPDRIKFEIHGTKISVVAGDEK
jgi:hypothetical protein